MKLIHCADIHLGACGRRLSGNLADQRRREIRDTFEKLAKYADDEKIPAVLMSGDVFDTDNVSREERKEFLSVIKKYDKVDFLYLRGNHDKNGFDLESLPENLKTFSDVWEKYSYGNVDVYGIEINDTNKRKAPLSLNPDKGKINIVMLHGTLDDDIILKEYATKGIDYMALGHIHTYSSGDIDLRGKYAYSGCLEGRGFDETGEKGFVLLDINDAVQFEFVKFAKRTIFNLEVSIEGAEDAFRAGDIVMEKLKNISGDDGVRVEITGEVDFDRERIIPEVERRLKEKFFLSEAKNLTTPYVDIDIIKNEISLRGRFVSLVLHDDSIDEKKKREIIFEGLKSLQN